ASSGITRNFQPKASFHALAHLQKMLGEYRFDHVVKNEAGGLRIQEYRHGGDRKRSVWVAWSQSGNGRVLKTQLTGLPGKLMQSQKMPFSTKETDARVHAA